MFICEQGFRTHQKKYDRKSAVNFVADINQYSTLLTPGESRRSGLIKPNLYWSPTLFDCNEHFIELSNMGGADRSLFFVLDLLLLFLLFFPLILLGMSFQTGGLSAHDWHLNLLFGGGMTLAVLVLVYFLWPMLISPIFFTYLRPRYRFNRRTRKVYVLRPKRYGGNVALDWNRVMAHPTWCAPREMTREQLHNKQARQRRQTNGGGPSMIRGLLLYWPPYDPEDVERTGEDVLWVGPKLADENLWEYIRAFMEKGIDAVPVPNEFEWLRKGFHTPPQHLDETELASFRASDRMRGRREDSLQTQASLIMALIWAPLHCLGERLCKWPTFPEEWNSDCGQRRRENGIGPEEPLRWSAKP